MELEVLISNKGTKVITATHLFQVLELSTQHYTSIVRRWLKDVYTFRDGIRRPLVMKDYAPRKTQDNPLLEDYYLSIELSQQITLHSKSKLKMLLARKLQELGQEEGNTPTLGEEALQQLLQLTKSFCLASTQEAAEQRHLQVYQAWNGGTASNWWLYRAQLLGYASTTLRQRLAARGQNPKGKTQRQMLQILDPLELIRAAIVDHFIASGKNKDYACAMGDLSKLLAREMKLGFFDDRQAGNLFAPEMGTDLHTPAQTRRKRA